MRRIITIIFVLLGGLIGGGFWSAASAANGEPFGYAQDRPFGYAPSFAQASAGRPDGRAPCAMIASARVPFVVNEGQVANPDVKYYARTFGGTVYALSDGKIVYSLPKYEAGKAAGSAVITESLRGAFQAAPAGAGKSPVAVSSFIGNRPENWKSNLSAFDRLDFGEVYEGISLLLSARGNNVEKIFVLSPGADPREIAFGFEGASGLEIMPDGKLELQTALGTVYFTRPVAWQMDSTGTERSTYGNFPPQADPPAEDNVAISERFVIPAKAGIQERELLDSRLHGNDRECGVLHPDKSCNSSAPLRQEQMIPVEVAYALDEDGTVRFELSSYDPNKILVIDPLLASTFIGGGGADAVQAMIVDGQTNVYVAGYTASSDFPTNSSSYCSTNNGGYDAFVSKFDANLGTLAASTYIGGSSDDKATAIGIDASSRIWIAGYTESANFPCGSSPMSATNNGGRDAFVAIFTNTVSTLVRATYLGGSNADYAAAIAMDNLSRWQYIAGYTESANFPVTNSTGYATTNNGARDAFIVLFSNDLTRAAYKTGIFLGGTNTDEAAGLVLMPGTGSTNFMYVVGSTSSTNFPVTNGCQMIHGGSTDAFVCLLSAPLTNLAASTFLGGTENDEAYAVRLDITNKVYVAGWTRSADFPQNPTGNVYYSSYANTYRGGQDVFAACLTNNLADIYASTYIGGTGDDAAKCLVVDSSILTNRVYVYLAGYTASSDFPATRAAYDRSHNGGEDAFVLRFDGRLTNLYASTYLGGISNDQALALALSPDTNTLFVAGITASSDFPASDAAYQNIIGGTNDGFVTKFPASLAYGTVKWKKLINDTDGCSSPAMTWDGTVVVGITNALCGFTRSGVERWRTETASSITRGSPREGLGVPAVGTNDVIYISTSSGKVHAISSAGAVNWTFDCAAIPSAWSAVAIDNIGRLFFAQNVKFFSVSQNGAGLWTNTPLTFSSFSAPVVDSNGTVYAANSVNPMSLYAFNPTNGGISHTWTTNGYMFSSPAVDTNGATYAASSNKFYAFNSDGTTGWIWTVGSGSESRSSPAIGTNGCIYIGGGSSLYAFNNAGTVKVWQTSSEIRSSPAISADGSIIVGSDDGVVYSFNSDGTTNWTCETDDFMRYETPFIDSEGTVYISDLGSVYAIYGSQPPADSAWPMFRHDALRTGNQAMNVAEFLRPAKPTVSKGTTTNYIRVGWNASSNALNYELWRSTNDSTAGAARLRRLTQTNYIDNDSSISSIEPGKVYYYWLKVKTPVALSGFSSNDYGGVPPYPPVGVTASDGDPTNQVQITWRASTNATVYYIYRDDTNAASIGSSGTTNYADTAVQPGQHYDYWVKAANPGAGESDFSASDSGGIPCWPPSGLSASQGVTNRLVALSWNISTNASSYIVYRHTEDNSAAAGIINDTTGLTMNDSVTPMRHYYYWLKATNEFGLSAFSASALGWSLLAPPQPVFASAGTYPNMIRVSWIAGSTDATVHVIFRSESSDPSTAARQSEVAYNYIMETDTNYDDTAITRGISYYYWVAAKNNYGSSIWVAASSPGATRPATPADLNATDGTYSNMVQVTWSASPGTIYYTVYRYETPDSSYATALGSSFTNYYNDRSAVYGVLYYYWVKAVNDYGSSDLSTFNSGWRGMVPPDSVTAGDGSSTDEVSVAWSAAPNAAFYELWRGTSNNAASANRLANNISTASYSDRSANPGTVYYYWVKSKRGSYSSAFSSSDSGYMAIGMIDIGVSDFVFVPTALGLLAHPSAVSFNVANLSGNDIVEPNNTVQYDFYLSRNPVFGSAETYWFGGTNSSITLSAGASTRVVLSPTMRQIISIPAWATGDYYAFVFVNHCLPSAWLDPNLANNVLRRLGDAITIASFTALQPVWNDFDGDGKSDLALYNGLTGSLQAGGWKVWLSASAYAPVELTLFGGAGYRAVPRDYDGDGKFDPAVYNEVTHSAGSGQAGTWLVCLSGSGYQTVPVTGWGGADQYAVPADYDGDGKVDPAVYQETTTSASSWQAGTWRGWMSGSGYAEVHSSGMGGSGWRPVPADYDGDGHADPSVYQETTGTWRVWLSGSSYQESYVINWGGFGQRSVPADYDGDGKVDPTVYQAGTWRVWFSSNGYRETSVTGWGGSGQTAVPGDYDGDGLVDFAVYWESMGFWRLWCSSYGYSEVDILVSGGEGFSAITAGE